MRTMYSVIILAAVLTLAATPTAALAQFDQVKIEVIHVRGNIYMLKDNVSGNVGVSVGEDGILIVDDKFAPLADKIRAALQEIGGGELQFILNTHWHHDHTDGNKAFGPEATVIAHSNVRKRVTTDQQILGRIREALPKEAWPVITFDHSVSIHFNGEEIKAVHLPHGHTDGDTIIFFTGSNVVHLGDDFFAGVFPFVDLASGGDVEGLTAHIAKLLDELPAEAKLIPGHGPVSTLDDLNAYHRMLVETTDIIRQRMAAGKGLEEIKAEGLPKEWASWDREFISTDEWIETVYRSLSR